MVIKKLINSIDELQDIQYYANKSSDAVEFKSEDGKIVIDAKSFIGLFSLDFTKPILIESEDEKFHKKIRHIGEEIA